MAPPGAAHVGEADVAPLKHFQRQQEFLEEHVLALARIGLGGEHADRIMGQIVVAEIGLAAPDRQHHAARHPESLLDRRKRGTVLIAQLLALRGEARNRALLEVVGGSLDELGLAALRRFGPTRNGEIGQRQVRLQPTRRLIEGRSRHAEPLPPQARCRRAIAGKRRRHGRRPPGAKGAPRARASTGSGQALSMSFS